MEMQIQMDLYDVLQEEQDIDIIREKITKLRPGQSINTDTCIVEMTHMFFVAKSNAYEKAFLYPNELIDYVSKIAKNGWC